MLKLLNVIVIHVISILIFVKGDAENNDVLLIYIWE